MASAAMTVSISTTAGNTPVFDSTVDGGPCRKFWVSKSTGGAILLINVPGLHAPGEWIPIMSDGDDKVFELGNDRQNGITQVFLQAAANTDNSPAIASFGVISRVYP